MIESTAVLLIPLKVIRCSVIQQVAAL